MSSAPYSWELDVAARATSIRRSLLDPGALRAKLQGPRTRYRDPAKIHAAVDAILIQYGVTPLIRVTIEEITQEKYRQDHRCRPSPNTRYIKHIKPRFDLLYEIDHQPDQRGRAGRWCLSAGDQ